MKWRPNVVDEDNLDWVEHSYGEKFGYRRKSLSSAASGQKLGCSLYEVPPGRGSGPSSSQTKRLQPLFVSDQVEERLLARPRRRHGRPTTGVTGEESEEYMNNGLYTSLMPAIKVLRQILCSRSSSRLT